MIMKDGFSTLITFADYPEVQFEEKSVTPPGVVGGGPIDTTTMRNSSYRSKAPKKLKDVSQLSATVAYDPAVNSTILQMINENQKIYVDYPDGERLTVWGWLDAFTPGEHTEGEQPTAQITIEISNRNELTDEEEGPVLTQGSSSGG